MSWDLQKNSSHYLRSAASYWNFSFLTGYSPSLWNWIMSWDPQKNSSHYLRSAASYWNFSFLTGYSPSLWKWIMSWDPQKNSSHYLRSAASYWNFSFLTGYSPSLWNWIMASLAVTGCWFAAQHCALNKSMATSNTLLCPHVYIWCDYGDAGSAWRKFPRSLLHDNNRSESVYPHNFRLLTFDRRSYIERRSNDIASGSIVIKDFHDKLIRSILFHFVQAHCLTWETAVAVLCSTSNILTSSLTMSLFPFGPTLKNTLLLVLPSPALLVWVTPVRSLIR